MFRSSHKSSARRNKAAVAVLAGSLAVVAGQAIAAPEAVTIGSIPTGGGHSVATAALLPGHVPDLVAQSQVVGAFQSSQPQRLSLVLPLRDAAGAQTFLASLYDVTSPNYGKFITPTEFADRFGPTQAQYNAVIAYAQSVGMTVVKTHTERTLLTVSAPISKINTAFGTTIKTYQAPNGTIFHAPSQDISVPSSVATSLVGVIGLDNANPPRPLFQRRSTSISETAAPAAQDPGEQGTGPDGAFTPSDLKTAYGLSGLSEEGSGQTVAMVEFGTAFNQKDVLQFEHEVGLPLRTVTPVVTDDSPVTVFSGASTETDLDIMMQLGMAPKASSILVYEGPGSDNGDEAIQQIATEDRAAQVSISYGFGPESATRTRVTPLQAALNTTFTQMAMQGQSVYISAGDSGSTAYRATGGPTTVDILGSEPMVCCVGGTALVVQDPGSDENYLAESTWNYNGTYSGGAGGGGFARLWPTPFYQTNAAKFASKVSGSHVSASNRNIPDVSLVASPETGVLIYTSVDPTEPIGFTPIGGTSASAPLWAGYTALVNQSRIANGLGSLGLTNASLYPLAYTSSGLTNDYSSLFHDIADGSSNNTVPGGTVYTAVTGFDDSTGLGTFMGANLLAALSAPPMTSAALPHHVPFAIDTPYLALRLANDTLPMPKATLTARVRPAVTSE